MNLDDSDELGTFIFRTTGFNSIRTLAARLRYYHAATNGLLSCLPLQLILRGKSTTQSYRQPVYYVDLTLRDSIGFAKALSEARLIDQDCKANGFNQSALDEIAQWGFENSPFQLLEEENYLQDNLFTCDTDDEIRSDFAEELAKSCLSQ